MAREALAAYRASLAAEWRAWLPADFGLKRPAEGGEARPWQMFTPGESAAGAGCLNGKAAACRAWLGIDRDADPYTTRYTASELRAVFRQGWYGQSARRNALAYRACLGGSDSSCIAFAHEEGQPEPVPADFIARRSLMRAMRDLHGAPALAAALVDTTGPIGARLARATGVGEDSLVLEWRRRVLGTSGAFESHAGTKEAVPALLFAGVLLLAAAGSGRWR